MSSILTGAGSVRRAFSPGITNLGSKLDGPDYLFGFYPRFGSLKVGTTTATVDTAVFYGGRVEFGSCQFGEFHGYLDATAVFAE